MGVKATEHKRELDRLSVGKNGYFKIAGELNRRVVVFAGEFGRHASRLAR